MKEKKGHSFVDSVIDAQGNLCVGDSVGNAFVEHFSSILGTKDSSLDHLPPNLFQRRLSISDANFMISQRKKSRRRCLLLVIIGHRVLMVFTARFFKSAWLVVGRDVEMAVQDFFIVGVWPVSSIIRLYV